MVGKSSKRKMTSASEHEGHAEHEAGGPGRPRSGHAGDTAAAVALVALAVLAAGCGGSDRTGTAGSASSGRDGLLASKTSPNGVMVRDLAYSGCMRNHGVPDFPDPTAVPGGGVAFQINGGPGSDLNHNNPRFEAAEQACHDVLPGGDQAPPAPTQKIAAEVKWAHCLRAHGVPGFPDPNVEGAFDSSRFDDSSAAFRSASDACKSVEPTGPVSAVPGQGGAS
jgi:hypothetical protein